MMVTPHPSATAVVTAGALLTGAAGGPWWLSIAAPVATLIAVTVTIVYAVHSRGGESKRTDQATLYQFLGAARVVRDRLAVVQEERAAPHDGYAAFDRLLALAYSSSVAMLVAKRPEMGRFFHDLGEFEKQLGVMRSALDEAEKKPPHGRVETSVMRRKVEEERENAAKAAKEAAALIDDMRLRLGDTDERSTDPGAGLIIRR